MCDNELLMMACKPLAPGTPPLSGHDLEHMLSHAEGWNVEHREDHHPEMTVGYNTCALRYNTHSIGGISQNDFICSAQVDHLVGD